MMGSRLILSTLGSLSRPYFLGSVNIKRVGFCMLSKSSFGLTQQLAISGLQSFRLGSNKTVQQGSADPRYKKSPGLMTMAEAEEVVNSFGDAEREQMKIIDLEYKYFAHTHGQHVLPELDAESYVQLLNLRSFTQRRKLFRRILKRMWSSYARQIKKEGLKQKRFKDLPAREPFQIAYPTNMINTIFLKQQIDKRQRMYSHNRIAEAMKFGPHIVIDLGFDNELTDRECRETVKQVLHVYTANYHSSDPFNIILTSVHPSNRIMHAFQQQFQKEVKTMGIHSRMVTLIEDDVTNVFPKESLVYLSPNAKVCLKKYDPNYVYIIGGAVDRANSRPFTMAKAKEHEIRMARFPLDEHLVWVQGGKGLTIDQAFKIMHDLKSNQPWKDALKHVPSRKIKRL